MKGILPVYLLMIVVDRGKAAKAARFLQEYSCPVQLILNGHGTASSKIMDYLGLDEPQKEIIISMAAGECASVILKRLEKEMNFSRPRFGYRLLPAPVRNHQSPVRTAGKHSSHSLSA